MARIRDYCIQVEDGDTFVTTSNQWIRLARVDTPEKNEPGWKDAKVYLEALVWGKDIEYEAVSTSYDRIVAEVWAEGKHVNEFMRKLGYVAH